MPEDRGAVVLGIALFEAEPRSQQGVPAGGIDNKGRRPAPDVPLLVTALDLRIALIRELYRGDAAALDDRRTFGGCILQKYVIERRAANLERIWETLVPGAGEIIGDAFAVIRRHEFDAVFVDRCILDFLAHAQPIEQR